MGGEVFVDGVGDGSGMGKGCDGELVWWGEEGGYDRFVGFVWVVDDDDF